MSSTNIDAQRQQAEELFAKGYSIRKVAAELGLTYHQAREVYKGRSAAPNSSKTKGAHLDPTEPLVRSDLIRRLRKGFVRTSILAERFGCTESELVAAVNHLDERGYNILWDGSRARITKGVRTGGEDIVDNSPMQSGWRVIGTVSDTHLASHFERLDVLEAAYDRFAELGITSVYHAGNIVDGQSQYNQFHLYAHGVTDQANYCLDHYPQRPGITTYFITGDCHEGWWFKNVGINFGRYLMAEAHERGRNDLVYLGHVESDVELRTDCGSAMMRLFHPGGGTAYAISYSAQKIIESLQGGEKPGLFICGHYHKRIYFTVRNVHVVQPGCTQDQTIFMRKKKLEAEVGYSVIRIQQDVQGAIRRVLPEFTMHYDRTYHVKHVDMAPAKKEAS